MRLLTYGDAGEERLAVIVSDRLAADLHLASKGSLPWDAVDFLKGGYLDDVRKLLERKEELPKHALIELDGVRIGSPVPAPGKVIALGLNYKDHAAELKMELPDEPLLFAKAPTAVCGPYDPIVYPEVTSQLDYEVELAVIMGRRCKDVGEEEALNYVAGYSVFNDVTARDLQAKDKQWFRGKSCDTFAPMGPYLVTHDEIGDVHTLRIRLWVNGELRQDSSTSNLIFGIPQIISFISKHMTLLPGDVIATGTPGGVGISRDPSALLKVGDVVEAEVERIGRLHNRVVSPRLS
ncbi:MAG: fumarylacetoacetate hydrolase family protein [Armatimonadota bacterium]|nr:fumarylacetoacetate hydrolase family protein [Armatimonadota bacterium]MCX7777567.1 fumarylacetoacetate hydrolase family protein [Armatimonadota bacterium]MDW8025576.1 fumarylacetoacetate hydrolase family protein [Armatimonadota bacterium]